MSTDAPGLPLGDIVDSRPAPRPQRVVLAGRHVDIVPFDIGVHGPALYERSHGPEKERLWAYLGSAPFESYAAFETHYAAAAQKDDPLLYAILDKSSGEAVGHATLMRIDPANRVIEVGNILYTPALMRTPGGTEAMELLARYIFDTLGYRRYEWKCNALNAPSRRAAERYGFRFEGIFRQHMIVKGRSRDTAWFSMLDSEWPQRAHGFAHWLASENFDADGRQRLPLGTFNADVIELGEGRLRRASLADQAPVEELQRRAYAKNRILLGVEPVPLMWDYAEVFREREVWVIDGAAALDAVLILEPRADDLLLDSLAISPMAQGRGLGNVLLAATEARARALGRAQVRLYTGEPLSANIAWYRRKGFAIERVEQMPDRRLVHMVRGLG
ncbi:RimJ/RimL family protein N-acetyltransferase/N-acetylglutamate synthase-like GNAT family acetyltransferase [Ancylobacter sp. 3268]|uniref:GNAT family N-acetyltransferase n=1 Tax=Ancylobacter sp. 3268 TaxID=2817752 RepID=UPI002858D848|nr:GNAT family N-acetyltransferase [Ancylobacter sp. 3268]MDR6952080.1 RimJ/RimL family protein N-acetyltransferase/N-acetylglutamate synthase-like GNAT family acetyltransferase [Ancylobacter sp. 3268]